ncbi:MAG: nicotinate phosphoribosyltransferase [Thermotogaceae bacterium]|nr:nicotinate phosphoribosyltransferase [Thermotogaceae bacterium]
MLRFDPSVFKIPIDRIRAGYYSDKYFTRYVDVLRKDGVSHQALYQVFPRSEACIVGIEEAVAILQSCTGYYQDPEKSAKIFDDILEAERNLQKALYERDHKAADSATKEKWALRDRLNSLWVDKWDEVRVCALTDGDMAKDGEIIMTIEGDPIHFGCLETVFLGVIARASSTATAVKKVVTASGGKPVVLFSARFDHYWVQATDGYAAFKAGAFGVSTDANADYWGSKGLGTIPHALIACYMGDTYRAAEAFDRWIEPEVNRIVLVDWDNDCIGTTKEVLKRFYEKTTGKAFSSKTKDLSTIIGPGKHKVWGVRFDTSGSLRDWSVIPHDERSLGVCPELVWRARNEFNRIGAGDLKIMVSGGFNAERIKLYERLEVPVDLYGVGSSLLREKVDFTADIVRMDGIPCAKYGRGQGDYSRLKEV